MRIIIISICVVFILAGNIGAESFTCNGNIIDRGYRQIEIIRLCGEPTFRNTRRDEEIKKHITYDRNHKRGEPGLFDKSWERRQGYVNDVITITTYDEWLYDLGSDRFVKILTFKEGRLVSIEEGHKGKKTPERFYFTDEPEEISPKIPLSDAACGIYRIQIGMTKSELYAKCGRPLNKERWEGKYYVYSGNGSYSGGEDYNNDEDYVFSGRVVYEDWVYPAKYTGLIIYRFSGDYISDIRKP